MLRIICLLLGFCALCSVESKIIEVDSHLPDFFELPFQTKGLRVKRSAQSACGLGGGRSQGVGTVPRAFMDENAPATSAYPPQGNGVVKEGLRIKDGLPKPPQELRLRADTADANPNEGRVEVLMNDKFGLVCDGYWDKMAASVACKQLGFRSGARLTKRGAAYKLAPKTSKEDVLIGKMRCSGKEMNIMACPHDKPNCDAKATAGVVCYYNDGCPYGWTSFNGMCYRLVEKPLTFTDAKAHCNNLKAKLNFMLEDKENNFLSDMLKLRFPKVKAAWTGGIWKEKTGADGRRYGAWTWEETIQTVSKRNNHAWFPGFTDGSASDRRPQKDYRKRSCIAMSTVFLNTGEAVDTDYFWWDNLSCKQKLPFICMRENFQWRGRSAGSTCIEGDGTSYRGTVSRTEQGSICQYWSSPDSFQNAQNTPGKGLGNHNYCRNPDADHRPWCWVNAARAMFGYCNIPKCGAKPPRRKTEPKATVHPPNAGFGLHRCSRDQFFCPSMYRYRDGCIEKRLVCDGRRDCNSQEDEDEKFCAEYLCSGKFYCRSNNYCIKLSQKCDGMRDCSDGADEKNCPKREGKALDYFDAINGKKLNDRPRTYYDQTADQCAEKCRLSARSGYKCMSFNHIPAKGDRYWTTCQLLSVNSVTVPSKVAPDSDATHYEFKSDCGNKGGFKCKNGRCLDNKVKCDRIDDCGDNSDENGCQGGGDDPKVEVRLGRNNRPERQNLNQPKSEGRVEVRYQGEWGQICDDGFDSRDADVVCRMLKYKRSSQVMLRAYQKYGMGNQKMMLSKLECRGNEKSIADCKHGKWRQTDCRSYQIVGIICADDRACSAQEFRCANNVDCVPLGSVCDGRQDCPDRSDEANCKLTLKLEGGKTNKEGRVILTKNNIAGTICKDQFDDKDAKVICKMLGFSGNSRAVTDGRFGAGTGVVWLDDVNCQGYENSLNDCLNMKWAPKDCSHKEDIGVMCDAEAAKKETSQTSQQRSKKVPCGEREAVQEGRVVGGKPAVKGQFPWQIAIRTKGEIDGEPYTVHWCGGAVLSDKWIITAAHCFKTTKDKYMIVVGDHDNNEDEGSEQNFEIDLLLIHPQWSGVPMYDYDLTLIRVQPRPGNKLIEFTKYVRPVCLPEKDMTPDDVDPENCFISGWGNTGEEYPNILQYAAVPLIPDETCRQLHRGAITPRMQCAGFIQGGIDTCQGDSGGPLSCKIKKTGKFVTWGQVSWGLVCAAPNAPGVFAKVTSMVDWVHETIKNNGGLW